MAEYIKVAQLPLLFFIIVLFFRARSALRIKVFRGFAVAFIFNFIYVLILICPTQSNNAIANWVFTNSKILSKYFDILTSFSFIYCSIDYNYLSIKNSKLSFGKEILFVSNILFAGALLVCWGYIQISRLIPSEDPLIGLKPAQLGRNALVLLSSAYSSAGLIIAFLTFNKESHNKEDIKKSVAGKGFLIWAALQALTIIPEGFFEYFDSNLNSITIIGFSMSLLSKVAILFGLFQLYIYLLRKSEETIRLQQLVEQEKDKQLNITQKEVELNNQYRTTYNDLLRNTFHELHIPIQSLTSALGKLNVVINSGVKREFLENALSNFERIKAIINNSSMNYKLVERPKHPFRKDYETKNHNITTILDASIRDFKMLYGDDVDIEVDFGAQCYVKGRQPELVQIFIILIKNAYEAYDVNISPKKIMVRAYLYTYDKERSQKAVMVEVEDYGVGIPAEIISDIWKSEFTTKQVVIEDPDDIRGQGLFVITELLGKYKSKENYKSTYISVESPIITRKAKFLSQPVEGTKFILKLPHSR
jgi:signal transduction histidine kinase